MNKMLKIKINEATSYHTLSSVKVPLILQVRNAQRMVNSGFSSNSRINLSPFTKDFRGEEQEMSL